VNRKAILTILLLLTVALSLFPISCHRTPRQVIHINGFEITLYDPETEFPNSLSFRVDVEAKSDISKISLHYQVDKRDIIPITSIVFPSFERATKVATGWKWDMRKTGGLPPGTKVRYWWSIEDTEGSTADSNPANISFDDKRYNWHSLGDDKIDLLWYDGSESFGEELLTAAEGALNRVSTDIGALLEQNAAIYIYASSDDLRAAMVYPQEWTGGVTFAEYGTIAIGISTSDIDWGKGAIAHELAHLVIHQAIFNGYGTVLPTWLDEGLAMYAQGGPSAGMRSMLRDALNQGKLFSAKSLTSTFPAHPEEAYLAYAQSYSLVEFLLQEKNGGKTKMLGLLNAFKNGSGHVEALRQVYDLDIGQLDSLWQQYVRSSFEYTGLSLVG